MKKPVLIAALTIILTAASCCFGCAEETRNTAAETTGTKSGIGNLTAEEQQEFERMHITQHLGITPTTTISGMTAVLTALRNAPTTEDMI